MNNYYFPLLYFVFPNFKNLHRLVLFFKAFFFFLSDGKEDQNRSFPSPFAPIQLSHCGLSPEGTQVNVLHLCGGSCPELSISVFMFFGLGEKRCCAWGGAGESAEHRGRARHGPCSQDPLPPPWASHCPPGPALSFSLTLKGQAEPTMAESCCPHIRVKNRGQGA